MQTIYYETSNFIRHEGNLVDLAAYRQKLAAVSGGNGAPAALGDGSAVPPWPWTSAPVRPSWS